MDNNKSKRKVLKSLFINLLLLSFTLIVCFALVEAGFRLFWKNSDNFYQSDPRIGQIHVPDKTGVVRNTEFTVNMRINHHGFVGRDYEYSKPDDVWRAVILGDSFVEAMQVDPDSNFSALLEDGLNSRLGPGHEAINLGVSNFGTIRSYLNLKNYGLKYDPDLAVLAFYIGNDITDNYMEQEDDPSYTKDPATGFKRRLKSFLLNNTRIFQYVREKSYQSVPLRRFFVRIGVLSEAKELDNQKEHDNEVNFKYHIYLREESEMIKTAWIKTREYLEKFNTALANNNIDFLVVIIPTRDQVYPSDWQEVKENFPALKEKGLDLFRPQEMLKSYLSGQAIGYLDLTPVFMEAASSSEERIYYRVDGHFTPYGHELAGQAIENYLINNNFIH